VIPITTVATYRTKQPGDILRLPQDLRHIPAGGYVLLSIGDVCILALVGENGAGNWVVTNRLVEVGIADLCRFLETGMRVDPLQ